MQEYLFATGVDWLPGLLRIEARLPIRYSLTGLHESQVPTVYRSASEIPSLGKSLTGKSPTDPAYLVMHAEDRVQVRTVPQRDGTLRYAIDQLINPGSAVITFGGIFNDTCVIRGEISTVAKERAGIALFKELLRDVTREFVKHEYWIGPDALRLHKQGARLTHSAGANPAYDFEVV